MSQLNSPTAVFVDLLGVMYIADNGNYRIQKWLPNEPLGTTVAGGRGNGATLDKIGLVYAIFVDPQGSVYISENSNHRVTLWFAWNNTAGQIVNKNAKPASSKIDPLLLFSLGCWWL